MRNTLVKLFASGLYTGYLRPFPGTWGTIPAWVLAWFVLKGDPLMTAAAAVLMTISSIAIASLAEPLLGHDARTIVIDEWAGMLIALILVPHDLAIFGATFVAFRVFDVIKVWPARQLEKLPGGLGVTMDDVAAGIQTNIFVQIVILISTQIGRM